MLHAQVQLRESMVNTFEFVNGKHLGTDLSVFKIGFLLLCRLTIEIDKIIEALIEI